MIRTMIGIITLAFTYMIASTAPASAQGTVATGDWREQYAYTLGMQAYVYGFPYVYMSEMRWAEVRRKLTPSSFPTPR